MQMFAYDIAVYLLEHTKIIRTLNIPMWTYFVFCERNRINEDASLSAMRPFWTFSKLRYVCGSKVGGEWIMRIFDSFACRVSVWICITVFNLYSKTNFDVHNLINNGMYNTCNRRLITTLTRSCAQAFFNTISTQIDPSKWRASE